MRFDHVAIPARNLAESIAWYTTKFGATVLYEDDTWAFLQLGGTKIALLGTGKHPPHFAVSLTQEALADAAEAAGKSVDSHRDGTRGIYIYDPSGNAIELISYPPGETVYAKSAKAGEKSEI